VPVEASLRTEPPPEREFESEREPASEPELDSDRELDSELDPGLDPASPALPLLLPDPSPLPLDAVLSPERPFEDLVPDDELDRRSSLAQPEPLKTMAGFERALRIVPSAPHSGQNFGPGSLIRWMTSVTRPQLLQL
jgi:hypothetical protein